MKLQTYLPIWEWLPQYNRQQLRGDLIAGLSVGVMLIPQGMAYAVIAGMPPIYGLYACTVPLVLYAILGTSRQLAVGPVAMVSILTASGIGMVAEGGTEQYILLAITLALMVGIFQFLLGVFRLGFLVNFLSLPVISGFTSAAALIIGIDQIKHLLGISVPRSHYIHEIIGHAIAEAAHINWLTFGIGLAGIGIILLAKRFVKAVPGQLLAVFFGILLVWGLGLSQQGVKIVGAVPEGLPKFQLPLLDWAQWQELIPIAFTISLVSFMGSVAVAKAMQARHKNYKVIPNQELIALGLANIGGAFFQSFPVTGGFSRTALNDQAGAQTGMASIISAGLIILTLLFLTPLFYHLPQTILASVMIVAVLGLIDYKEALHLWRSDRRDFWMLLVTFLSTLGLGIELGIGIGVMLSLILVIYRTTQPYVAILGRVPGTHYYRDVDRFEDLVLRRDLLIIRFDAQLFFANINFVKETLEKEVARKGATLKVIIICGDSTNGVDSSAVHGILELAEDFKKQGISLYFSGLKGQVRDALKRARATEKIGKNNFFISIQEAVDYHDYKQRQIDGPRFQDYVLQVNE